jgi:hypothetical protein
VVSEPEEESLSSGGGAGRLRIAEALLPRFLKAGTVGAASAMVGGVVRMLSRLSEELVSTQYMCRCSCR